MTMHLLPHVTTTRITKHKSKVTKAKMQQWQSDHKAYNARNKRNHLPQVTFDEYLDLIHGRVKLKKEFTPLKSVPTLAQQRMQEHREKYPSLDTGKMTGECTKQEPKRYTGSLVKGVATMHKSNAVPVIDEEHMKDISRMRR